MVDSKVDEAIGLLSQSYQILRSTPVNRKDPLYDSWLHLMIFVEHFVIDSGGQCPE